MRLKETRSGGEGLERSCNEAVADWIVSAGPVGGVELFRAWFAGKAYAKHRHDTYAIGLTDCGVQVFDYGGSAWTSTRGRWSCSTRTRSTTDGRGQARASATGSSTWSRLICPTRSGPIADDHTRCPSYVSRWRRTPGCLGPSRAPSDFRWSRWPSTVSPSTSPKGCWTARGRRAPVGFPRVDAPGVERARQFLDAERTRVVHSTELEAITGLTRYDLARQFRLMFGTSPYRYLLMRRLELARQRIHAGRPLADVAGETGFADQAHFTRAFKAAFGLTPARYRTLRAHPPASLRGAHPRRLPRALEPVPDGAILPS